MRSLKKKDKYAKRKVKVMMDPKFWTHKVTRSLKVREKTVLLLLLLSKLTHLGAKLGFVVA